MSFPYDEVAEQIVERVDGTRVEFIGRSITHYYDENGEPKQVPKISYRTFYADGRPEGAIWYFGDTGAFGHSRKRGIDDDRIVSSRPSLLLPTKETNRFFTGEISRKGKLKRKEQA